MYKTKLSYYLKCPKNTESKNPSGKIMVLSNCRVCGSKKTKSIKVQKGSGLLISLWIRTPFSQTPLVGLYLF